MMLVLGSFHCLQDIFPTQSTKKTPKQSSQGGQACWRNEAAQISAAETAPKGSHRPRHHWKRWQEPTGTPTGIEEQKIW
jgi:hypothetical protein